MFVLQKVVSWAWGVKSVCLRGFELSSGQGAGPLCHSVLLVCFLMV